MADATIFKIMSGQLGLAVVDRATVGYLDTWRAPAGKNVTTAVLADYTAGSSTFMCQVTNTVITSSPDTTTEDIEATMSAAAKTIPTPGESTFAIDIGALSDMNKSTGLQRFAFENDAAECYVYIGFDGTNPPKAIGRVVMASLPIGGDMRAKMLGTVTWPFTFKPQINFGDATTSVVVPSINSTGATAGVPGTWTPAGSTPPANAAGATAVVASPATAWTVGQYVQGSTAGAPGEMNWSGSAWVTGRHA